MKVSKISFGIALLAMISLFACAQKHNIENDLNVSPVDDDKSIQINWHRGISWTSVEIPAKIRNLPVTRIGDGAYQGKYLSGVTIPDSVTQIKSFAFADNQLSSVSIPNSVTQIERSAFFGNKLASVIIPDSVTKIEKDTFAGNQLRSVTIPDSVTQIEKGAFADNQLISVVIPDSVTKIGPWAFQRNQLLSITIGKNVALGHQGHQGYEATFNTSFDNFYRANGSRAGTYHLDGGSWKLM